MTHYVIEIMDLETKGTWLEAGEVKADITEFNCKSLQDKHRYKFRVRAQNKIGLSEPTQCPDTILAKDPWGNFNIFHYEKMLH